MHMIEYAKFDMIYMGIYSPRPGTLGAKKYEDNVSRETKKERRQRMNTLLRDTSEHNNQQELGTTRLMMVNKIEKDFFSGYTDNMKTVVVRTDHIEPSAQPAVALGDFIKIRITKTDSLKLFAEVVTEE